MPDLGSVHYGDLVQQNIGYYTSQLLGMNYSAENALAILLHNKSSVDAAALFAGYGQGLRAYEAGQGFRKLGNDRFVGPATTPVNASLPENWRYVLQVEVIDPAGGPSSFRMMVIDSDVRLRKGELQEAMLSNWNAALSTTGYPSVGFAAPDFARIKQVQSIETRF